MIAPAFGRAARDKKTARPVETYLVLSDLPERGIHYCMNHLRRMWNDGRFPKPLKLSPRKLVWRASDIDAWIAAKVSEAADKRSA